MQNLSFTHDDAFSSLDNKQRDVVQAQINMINASADIIVPLTDWRSRFKKIWSNYRWRMRHYFYIHLSLFFMNSLLSGLITWAIEDQKIPFIDCWFMGATCVFTCGLQTYDFGSFSQASQIILLLFTLVSGITVSTIPAIFIKIFQAKRKSNTAEDISSTRMDDNNILPVQSLARQTSVDPVLRKRLQSLPDPYHLRITAYIILIVLIVSTCLFIYLFTFFSVGFWFKYNYILQHYSQINKTVNPFYASLVVTITSFNQNGLTSWKNGASIFVDDIFMNIIIMIAVMSGTSLFPAILRGIVNLIKYVAPWRYKIYFDYILLNNHRLSAVIFPSIQTRLYVTSTILMQILGVTVALILDYNNPILSIYTGGKRFMIFMFLTVNTRFAGYYTIDLTQLTEATLIIFVLAFGGCGLSMEYSTSSPNLVSAFTVPSKIILIFSMCMGRHRGLLDSMKDQEEIEYSAQTLIQSWRHLAMYEQQQQKKRVKKRKQITTVPYNFSSLTSYISTRF
ncbi:unnamed protein product [Rotaria magnacalcarata]